MPAVKVPTLTQLRLLAVVQRTESLGAAARALGLAQPTVSLRAQELERRCGVELFSRGMYTTYLTDEGRRVAEQAKRVLDEYEGLLVLIGSLTARRRPLGS